MLNVWKIVVWMGQVLWSFGMIDALSCNGVWVVGCVPWW